jgi:hypothetical protein
MAIPYDFKKVRRPTPLRPAMSSRSCPVATGLPRSLRRLGAKSQATALEREANIFTAEVLMLAERVPWEARAAEPSRLDVLEVAQRVDFFQPAVQRRLCDQALLSVCPTW